LMMSEIVIESSLILSLMISISSSFSAVINIAFVITNSFGVESVSIKHFSVSIVGHFTSELLSSKSSNASAYSQRCRLLIHSVIFDKYSAIANFLIL
jgi:hypothetical protein